MRILLLVAVMFFSFFPVDCFSQFGKSNIPNFDKLIRDSRETNEQLLRKNAAARNDAIIAVAILGRNVSKERREEIHLRMVDSLEYVRQRLEVSGRFISLLTADDPRIDEKLLNVGIWHNEVADLYYLFKELRQGLEEGRYDYTFFDGF